MKKLLILILLLFPLSANAKDLILFCKPDNPSLNFAKKFVFKIEKNITSKNKIYYRSFGVWKDYCSYGGLITDDSFNCKFSKEDLSENFILDLVTYELLFYSKEKKYPPRRWTCKEKN